MKHRDYIEQLTDALKTNTYISEVHLAKVDLDAVDAKRIGDMLTVNDSIEVLSLENNKISNEGAKDLASGLRRYGFFLLVLFFLFNFFFCLETRGLLS